MDTESVSGSLFRKAVTTSGAVLGLVNDGVIQFKGIRYGAPTAGERRFRHPVPPAPWTGLRECLGYGPICPQAPTPIGNRYGRLIQFDMVQAEGGMGEDCLHLNVWTSGVRDGRRRPVIVSIHGGGFVIASGNARIYDGARLAQSGDVVVVTLSHRLASFGFLDLAACSRGMGDPAFDCNVGLADLVLALRWIRENIEAFGGDPGRVLLWGQSGGGWKVSCLMAMPAARGLFSRAAIQSGSLLRVADQDAAAAAEAFLHELGVARGNLSALRHLPWTRLLDAQIKVGAQRFMPGLDGTLLPRHPFDPSAPPESAEVPLIVSTTRHDAGLFFNHFALDDAGLTALLRQQFGERAAEIEALYRAPQAPAETAYLKHARIVTDAGFRRFAYAQADRKAQQSGAPVYLYQWNWPSPAYDGMFGAVHAIDVAAVFGNVRDAILGAGCSEARALSSNLSQAWVAFAAEGRPGAIAGAPWPPYDPLRRACLVLDRQTAVSEDPDRALREYWERQPPPASVFG